MARYLVPALAFFAALTATFGNLAAYPQTNLKRLLAYSTIAHAGYMMMGLAHADRATGSGGAVLPGRLPVHEPGRLRRRRLPAQPDRLGGPVELPRPGPAVAGAGRHAGVFLLSLLGIPPLAGFAAKFQIFACCSTPARTTRAGGAARAWATPCTPCW